MDEREIIALRLMHSGLSRRMDAAQAVRALCGIQAQFAGQARHALALRAEAGTPESALSLCVRTWTLRGTMHMILREDAPLFLYAGRTHTLRPCDTFDADDALSAARKAELAGIIREAVARGAGDRAELRALCARRGMTDGEAESAFNAWGGLLRAMAERGEIAYDAGVGKRFVPLGLTAPMAREPARDEILRRYFAAYGPATAQDAAYFTGWGLRDVRERMARMPLGTIACGGETYYAPADVREDAPEIPACLYLAGFDPLMLGYEKKTSLHLPEGTLRGIFSLAGIVSAAVLLHGRVAGKWKRQGGRVMVTPFRPLAAQERRDMAAAARATFGDVRLNIQEA